VGGAGRPVARPAGNLEHAPAPEHLAQLARQLAQLVTVLRVARPVDLLVLERPLVVVPAQIRIAERSHR